MSLNHVIAPKYPQSIIVQNITMPTGSDIDAHNGIFRGDLKLVCDDASELQLNPPNKGNNGEVLTSNGDGSVEFKDVGSIGFVTNPLSATLNASNNNIINVNNLATNGIGDQSNLSQIFMNPTDISIFTDELKLNGNEVLTSNNGVKNPMNSDLDANLNNIVNVNQLTTDSIGSTDLTAFIDFNVSGEISLSAVDKTKINSTDVLLNTIKDLASETSYIAMNPGNIELNSASVTVNTNEVLVTPLQGDIDANSKKIINVDRMTVSSIADSSEQRIIDFSNVGEIQVYATAKTTINSAEVLLNSIKDYDTSTSIIDLSVPDEITLSAPVNINLDALTVRINARDILTTPLQSDIDANNKNIENANVITVSDSIGNTTLSEAFYFNVPNQITIGTNYLTRMTIANASITFTNPILEGLGTASAPTYSFTGDTNTGMYSAGADQLGFTTGGTNRMLITTTDINLTSTNINYNSRTAQLVDIHNNNNTYAGLTSGVGTQYCTSYGNLAGSSTSGNYNTAIGYNVMPIASVSAYENTGCGALSLFSLTSGIFNTGHGVQALRFNTTGNRNTAIGHNSGYGYTTGSENTSVGALSNDSTINNGACNQCVAIGVSTRTNGNTTNSIVLGYGVVSTISNECIIGNSSVSILRNAGNGVCDLGTSANKFKDLYLSGNIGISGHTITPNGGLYLSTSSGPTITGTGVVNLLDSVSSVGSLAFASGFPSVSGYRMRFITTLNGVNNDILYLKFLLNAVQILALDVTLSGGSSKAGIIELEFYITTLSSTVGVVNMLASYQYDDGGTIKGDTSSILYSTLNTTIAQPLTITAAFNTASVSNSIQCTRAVLNKVY